MRYPITSITIAFFAVAAMTASSVFAQAVVTAEGLFIAPENVPSNQQNVELTIIALDGELFAHPSGRAPEFEFGPGVTVKSVAIDSGKMARVVIDTGNTAFGAIETRVKIYSLDGQTVSKMSSSYLGVTGPVTVEPLTVQATENRRVEIDGLLPQTIGNVRITGPLSGPILVYCPTGATIAPNRVPVVKSLTSGVSILDLAVFTDRSGFSFTVFNPIFTPVTLSVEDVVLDLREFTASGGQRGDIAMSYEMSGNSQTVAISSARTPGQTVENPTAEFLAPPAENPANPTTNPPPANSYNPNDDYYGDDYSGTGTAGSPLGRNTTDAATTRAQQREARAREREARARERAARDRQQRNNTRGGRTDRGAPMAPQAVQRGRTPAAADAAAADGQPAAAGRSEGAAASAPPTSAPVTATPRAEIRPTPDGAETRIRVESFTLCDERFRPLTALGFRSAGDGTFTARVWVQLVVSSTRPTDRQKKLEVEIFVPEAEPIRTILHETASGSGVYRCEPDGIDVTLNLNR